jgi:hypothetical protein
MDGATTASFVTRSPKKIRQTPQRPFYVCDTRTIADASVRLGHRVAADSEMKTRRSRFPDDSGARADRFASSVSRFRDVAMSLGESDFFLSTFLW